MVYLAVCTAIITAGHHIEHTIVFAILEGGIDTHVVTICLHRLANLLFVDGSCLCQL